MKKQHGGVLISLIVVISIVVLAVAVLWSYANKATDYEVNINRFDQNTRNVLSSYTLKIREMAQVPEMYTADLRTIIQDTFQGRYGEDGSQAAFQWIQEQNHQLDSSVHRELQLAMRSGRDEFRLAQDRKLEICADYERLYTRPVSRAIIGFMGYPDSDIPNKCRIVIDQQTRDTFDSGIATEIRVRS